jgi:hypothetical protein
MSALSACLDSQVVSVPGTQQVKLSHHSSSLKGSTDTKTKDESAEGGWQPDCRLVRWFLGGRDALCQGFLLQEEKPLTHLRITAQRIKRVLEVYA